MTWWLSIDYLESLIGAEGAGPSKYKISGGSFRKELLQKIVSSEWSMLVVLLDIAKEKLRAERVGEKQTNTVSFMVKHKNMFFISNRSWAKVQKET